MALGFKKFKLPKGEDLAMMGGAGLAALGGPIAPLILAAMYKGSREGADEEDEAERIKTRTDRYARGEFDAKPEGLDAETGITWNQARPEDTTAKRDVLRDVAPEAYWGAEVGKMYPKAPTPLSTEGQRSADARNGFLTPEQADTLNTPAQRTPGRVTLVSPDGARRTTKWENDPSVSKLLDAGWLDHAGAPSTSTGNADTSLNPTYGRDADGNIVIMQTNKDGELIRSSVPDGVTPLDPRGLSFERAMGASTGKATAERTAQAPAAIVSARSSLKNIQDLKNHPNLSGALGLIEGRLPALGGSQADVVSRIEQMQGQAFLQAFETLKGSGQITEVEGKKATDAIARLNRQLEPQDFKAALTELEDIVQIGLVRAEQGLTVGGAGGGAGPAPTNQMTPTAAPSAAQSAPTPQTQKEFDALPSGSVYIDPDDGRQYRKP